jgi:uncharacterized protein
MWEFIVRFILRNRNWLLAVIILLTIFMGWQARGVKLSYELAQMLPSHDPAFVDYQQFREIFGEDGNVVFLGIEDPKVFELDAFLHLQSFLDSLKVVKGVKNVLDITSIPEMKRLDAERTFIMEPVFNGRPGSQQQLDSLLSRVFNLPFYSQLLFNEETGAILAAVTLDAEILNTPERVQLIKKIQQQGDDFTAKTAVRVHYSGLPFIRTKTSLKVEQELQLFVLLAMLVASLALYLFFRSLKATVFPMIIVVISVIWALGTISLLGYEITILTGIIPPLLIIIGVENCIFLLNKYHHEYRAHGNKVKSLARVVQRVGNATLLTNATTAVGFATFAITGNRILVEFGIVAALNILTVFILTLTLVPIFYSYLAPPQKKHTRHLNNTRIKGLLSRVIYLVSNKRPAIYTIAVISLVIGIFGMSRLHTSGNLVDDIPQRDQLYQDLRFFERNISGIMPMEIMIDTRRANGVMRPGTLDAIEALQQELALHPELSRPLSAAEALKFARQAFYRGEPGMYAMPHRHDRAFIMSYIPKGGLGEGNALGALVDTAMQTTRVSVLMANLGTRDIRRLQDQLRPKIDSIFPAENYHVTMTGTSVVFLKGTDYLVKNLLTSLLFAVAIISLLIALLFNRARMVMISLVPNIFPQVLTAALMGFLGIPIKPSTILIFSIALGISVDNSIHFLAKFRQELPMNRYNIRLSVLAALSESGVSMIYTFVVLFFGFIIFTASSFGGTQALGYLIAFTLSVALLSNLFLMPSILLSLHKRVEGKQLEGLFAKKNKRQLPFRKKSWKSELQIIE